VGGESITESDYSLPFGVRKFLSCIVGNEEARYFKRSSLLVAVVWSPLLAEIWLLARFPVQYIHFNRLDEK
jgi:hypothetical protein